MIITCKNCNTSYNLDPAKIAATGSRVRCSNCGNVFVVYPPAETSSEETSETIPAAVASAGSPPHTPAEVPGAVQGEAESAGEAPQTDEAGPDASSEASETVQEWVFEEEKDDNAGPDEGDAGAFHFEDQDWSTASETPVSEEAEELNLDLDLDFIETAQAGAQAAGAATEEMGSQEVEDLGLDLDLDFDATAQESDQAAGAEAAGVASEGAEELDLDLDLDFDATAPEGGQAAGAEAAGVASEGTEELDLELDLDFDATAQESDQAAGAEAAGVASEGTEELDLELDLDFDQAGDASKEGSAAGTFEAAEAVENLELDLDLDSVFDETADAGSEAEEPQELELDLDLDQLEAEPAAAPATSDSTGFQDEELDLSDIEKMLETGEGLGVTATSAAAVDQPTLDLKATPSLDEEETEVSERDAGDSDLISTFDLEAETAVLFDEETDQQKDAVEKEIAAYTETYELGAGKIPEHLGAEPTVEVPQAAQAAAITRPAKKGVGKSLIAALILLLAAGGVYGAHLLGVRIPFVSDLLEVKVEDEAGNLKIATFGIDSRFVENASAGRLFVIAGKVRNDYPQPRSLIQVRGNLYAKGKKLVGTETVYCGNVLADLDLAKLSLAEIKNRLNVRTGANKSNLNVASAGVVPFMVVFSNLPSDLEEFTIEVASSQ